MSGFLRFFYEFFMSFITALVNLIRDFFVNIFDVINVVKYAEIFNSYMRDFAWYEWIFAILTLLIFTAFLGLVIYLIVIGLKSWILKRKARLEKQALVEQIDALNKKVLKLIDEKDKIMAMQVSKLGINPEGETAVSAAGEAESRFVKLTEVDRRYNYEIAPFVGKQDFDLKQLINMFRGFANNTLRLYYNEETIRCFIAGMASSRLLILEGISGTGKTSLPYAFGKFLKHDTTIVPVQPSWRDKTELVGYFNEFTKRFNETDFLKSIYEYTYREDIGFIVLDEMNLARIEYYFASVLSILEMPNRSEWTMEIVGDKWPTDPRHLVDGKIRFPANVWFVGTANQDDSTFTITDKVYDRAVPIQLNSKGKPFDIDGAEATAVSLEYLEGLFNKAKAEHGVSEDTLKKFDKLDDFIIQHFRLAFGNRILKQLNDFVPVYVGCGGSELDGVDFILTYKILRKLEGLNMSFVQDSIKATIAEIERLFGKKAMPLAKDYLASLIKNA